MTIRISLTRSSASHIATSATPRLVGFGLVENRPRRFFRTKLVLGHLAPASEAAPWPEGLLRLRRPGGQGEAECLGMTGGEDWEDDWWRGEA